jgi:ribosomal protein S18 acetylase RimI-like enzyme
VSIRRRVFAGAVDLPLVLDLIRVMPTACRHVLDFGWRLTAPAIAAGRDAVYWQDAGGRVAGLAAWQQTWATLDLYVRPGPDAVAVERGIFAWAGERFRERDGERGHRLPYAVEFRDDDQDRQALAEAHGFVHNPRACNVYLECQLDAVPPPPAVPDGFAIRPLGGAAEAAAYAEVHGAAFGGEAMTAPWRERTIGTPLHQPDLDLVAVAPDGTLAGFCVGWHNPVRGLAQLEPVGVHPRYQRRGLSRALIAEMFRRFKGRGASVAIVETEFDRTAARAAYEAAGFGQTHTIWRQEAWATDIA